jgi:F-type H+-transporting ATPase subunit b
MSSTPETPSNAMPKLLFGVVVGGVLIALGMTVFKDTAPPLLQGIDFNLGKTLVQIGVVLILFPLIFQIFVKPLSAAIGDRNTELQKTFTETEDLRTDMTQLKADYEKRLAERDAEARTQIQAAIKEAQTLRQTLMAEASERADQMLRAAEAEIEAQKQQALTEIRTSIVNLSLAAAEKVVNENMDSDKNRKLISRFIDELEVAH